eukprot:CAMPEP_0172536872 /NCGR_PEP_ID=MMETSP1067-20121228/8592_1 /TAXON_ID=265564 ORGANISM="Thalassiosira punctigera, Strain Tpunct2005C2" /NCGR_SAMPLE_ID=MMETSP1067 /ASSEMBLY_ACC=CAM_ASM_000444 /LENGTH=853 /DNA_ID=CAMNT_0013322053 /DNA_START=80 /DNA_END=2638 /DNA_ORIENTATION=-
MISSGTSEVTDGIDLIGLISSFLGQSPSDADGDASKPSASWPPSREYLSPSMSGDAVNVTIEDNAFSGQESTIPPARVIVFSKDRPWQLQQLLRSMKLHRHSSLLHYFNIHIILRASSPKFCRGYERVMHEYDGMHFLMESDHEEEKSFSSLLEHALTVDTCENMDNGVVMFLTDDCLLLEPLGDILACAAGVLCYEQRHTSNSNSGGHVFNFLSRLHPGISWCQTRGVASPPPRDEMKFHSLTRYLRKLHKGEDHVENICDGGVYLYNRNRCSGDWAYHFDLSGGVYCQYDVLALLQSMKIEEKRHPNILEMRANRLLNAADDATAKYHLGTSQKSLSAIPTHPSILILAINRVQDVFQAPLATPQKFEYGGISVTKTEVHDKPTVDPTDPASLLTLLDEEWYLDGSKYKSNLFNSSHIGDFFIKQSHSSNLDNERLTDVDTSESASPPPKVSVLIPVHRGPPDAASHSIISIIMQPIEEIHSSEGGSHHNEAFLSPMQIVLVDDRCNDGSIDSMIASCNELVKNRKGVSLQLRDHRSGRTFQQQESNTDDQRVSIWIDIVDSPQGGIACALNHGLSYCSADLVARMDADDVATPHRLLSQISFMRANPSFAAVGTSTVLFSEGNQCSDLILPYDNLTQSTDSCLLSLRPSLSISDPGFMAWAMFFTCSISHPSVTFRKNVIQKLGGYDVSISYCEDYDLWLRLLDKHSRSIICIPFHGLWHRKHNQSSSSVGLKIQKEEADQASCRAMEQIFQSTSGGHGPLALDHISTLRNPSSAKSPECLDHAAKLLLSLESSFLEKNSLHLSQQEIALIELDCNARIGELATIFATKFRNKSKAGLDYKGSADTSFTW